MLEWLESLGGVEGMAEINRRKAGILYDYLDSSKFYIANVDRDSRSIMNVTYHCPTKELDAKFVAESVERGFQNLKGYRSVGGIRASIYNAMPVEGRRGARGLHGEVRARKRLIFRGAILCITLNY